MSKAIHQALTTIRGLGRRGGRCAIRPFRWGLLLLLMACWSASVARGEDTPARTENGAAAIDLQPSDEPLSPRELLELYRIPAEQLDALVDGTAITSAATETDLMLRVMYRYPEIPKLMLEKWAKQNAPGGLFDWSLLATLPAEHRGKVFPLKGRVVSVNENKLDEQVAQRYQLSRFYRVRLQLNGSNRIADIFVQRIPHDWKDGQQAGMQSGALAMFLKRGDTHDPADPLVFVADRVAWYTDTLLGDLGVDGGLFDDVVSNRGIGKADRELFYQILHAAGIVQTNELARYAGREIVIHGRNLLDEQREMQQQLIELEQQHRAAPGDQRSELARKISEWKAELRRMELRIERARQNQHELFPMLEHPSSFEGRLMMFRGIARRITKVRVEDPDIVERFDIDHYYQIDATVNLEFNVTLKGPEEGEPVREMWTFPVTFCARRLPAGMPTGDNVNEEVRLAGFFFKKWSYELEPQAGQAKPDRFSAPMLIGREPIWIRPDTAAKNPYNGLIAGTLFLIALLGVWLGVWRLGRGDRIFQRNTLARNYTLAEGVSLNELELEETVGPDFSYLSEVEDTLGAEAAGEAATSDHNGHLLSETDELPTRP